MRRQRRRGVRGDLRGLHHDAVAGGDRADQRRHHHGQRVIPWRDDQHHALGLGLDVAAAGLHHHRRAHALRTHPVREVLAGVLGLGLDEAHLRQHGLEEALAEIEAQRLGEIGFVLAHHALDLRELREAPFDRPCLAAVERLPQPGERARQGGAAHWESPYAPSIAGYPGNHSTAAGTPGAGAAWTGPRRMIRGHLRSGASHDGIRYATCSRAASSRSTSSRSGCRTAGSRNSRSRTTPAVRPWWHSTTTAASACCGNSATPRADG